MNPITQTEYAEAIATLAKWAQGDTSAALPAATVLLSAYNGQYWQLDITDLCHLDPDNYAAALTVIRGRIELRREPQYFLKNGDAVFRALWDQWERYHVNNRWKSTCGQCAGSGKVWQDGDDYGTLPRITCARCGGDGLLEDQA
ncbi:MAG: hypothetical protein ABW168_00295 [Sedimenticola sp.]